MRNRSKNHQSVPVTPEEFVRTWQTSTSTQEVMTKLGMSVRGCHARAHYYRKRGVSLKTFSRITNNGIDFDNLNKIARECL